MSATDFDVAGFVAMVEELSRMAEKPFPQIIIPQIGALLKASINRTPVRRVGDIAKRISRRGRYIEFSDGTVISVWKKASFEDADGYETAPTMFLDDSTYPLYAKRWPKKSPKPAIHGGKSWHRMDDRHWSDARFGKYQALNKKRIEIMRQRYRDALAARGLAKKTWGQIADDLGLDLHLPKYIVTARDQRAGTREYKEGIALQLLEQGVFIIEIANYNPLFQNRIPGRNILAGALRDREKAFMTDLEKGVFEDVKRRAERYPGIFVN